MLHLESYGLKVIQILLFLITTLWTVKKAYTCIPSAHISINLDKVTWETPKATAHMGFHCNSLLLLQNTESINKNLPPSSPQKTTLYHPSKNYLVQTVT